MVLLYFPLRLVQKNRATQSHQSRIGRQRFPAFCLVSSYSEFSLALRAFSFRMIGSWNYFFFFYDIQSKSALLDNNSYDTNNDNDITFLLGNSSRNRLFPKCISTRKFKWNFYANNFISSISSSFVLVFKAYWIFPSKYLKYKSF